MKALPWLIAGLAVGAAVAIVVLNDEAPAYASGDVESAANEMDTWGAKQRIKGTGGSVLGAVKEKFGEVTGDQQTADEGTGDRIVGDVKDAAGKVANAASDVVRDFNRA